MILILVHPVVCIHGKRTWFCNINLVLFDKAEDYFSEVVCACVRACVHVCLRACMRAYEREDEERKVGLLKCTLQVCSDTCSVKCICTDTISLWTHQHHSTCLQSRKLHSSPFCKACTIAHHWGGCMQLIPSEASA